MDSSFVTTSLVAVSVVLPLLATGAVVLRFYARSWQSQGVKLDDWVILFSLVRHPSSAPQKIALARCVRKALLTGRKQFLCWLLSINTLVMAGLAGVDRIKIQQLPAATAIQRVNLRRSYHICLHADASSLLLPGRMDFRLPTGYRPCHYQDLRRSLLPAHLHHPSFPNHRLRHECSSRGMGCINRFCKSLDENCNLTISCHKQFQQKTWTEQETCQG